MGRRLKRSASDGEEVPAEARGGVQEEVREAGVAIGVTGATGGVPEEVPGG